MNTPTMAHFSKTDWGLMSAGLAAVTVPSFFNLPIGDYLYAMPPVAMLAYIAFVYGVGNVDHHITSELDNGAKFIMQHPGEFVVTWLAIAAVVGYGVEYVLEFIEPVLDIFEVILPDGFQLAWILSPYSPYFLSMTAFVTFVISMVTTDFTKYTYMAVQSLLHSFVPWDIFQPKDPHFYYQGKGTGGRYDKNKHGGDDYGYGIAHLPRDIFQFFTTTPLTFIYAFYDIITGLNKGQLDLLPLVLSPITIATYMFHRFGDIVLDIRFITKDIKQVVCVKHFITRPLNPFAADFKMDDYRLNC